MSGYDIAPFARLADGVKISVQASEFHYATPRDNYGPWSHVEVGCITGTDGKHVTPPSEWLEYADAGELPSDVYGYVPVALVRALINAHGGIKSGEPPALARSRGAGRHEG